jgi:hypothetical protein
MGTKSPSSPPKFEGPSVSFPVHSVERPSEEQASVIRATSQPLPQHSEGSRVLAKDPVEEAQAPNHAMPQERAALEQSAESAAASHPVLVSQKEKVPTSPSREDKLWNDLALVMKAPMKNSPRCPSTGESLTAPTTALTSLTSQETRCVHDRDSISLEARIARIERSLDERLPSIASEVA